MPKRKWTDDQLVKAVKKSFSYRQVLKEIGLKPAGGNYVQVRKYIELKQLPTTHFRGKTWNKGLTGLSVYRKPIEEVLVNGFAVQSYKLKKRLFFHGLKIPKCELCGWSKMSANGRIPLELDHINGNSMDNRLENLRILCPNCHSLQATHRGKNKK